MQVQNDPASRWANASVTKEQKAVHCRGTHGKGPDEGWVVSSFVDAGAQSSDHRKPPSPSTSHRSKFKILAALPGNEEPIPPFEVFARLKIERPTPGQRAVLCP